MTSIPLKPVHILFMCVANSARSQIAEGLAKQILGTRAEIRSAGSQPTKVNPFAIRVLNEVGADFRSLFSKSIEDLPPVFVENLDYVITLCAEEVCPVMITKAKRLHWPLPDPAGVVGSEEDILTGFRSTRVAIEKHLERFSQDIS